MKQTTLSKIDMLENFVLLMWGSTLSVLLFIFLYLEYKKHTEKKALPIRVKPPFFKEPEKKAEEGSREKVRLKKSRAQDEEEPPQLTSIYARQIEEAPIRNKKAEKRRNSDASTVTPALFSHHQALPAEIRFSDEFVYPSPCDAQYQVYPLPGQERAKPIAKIKGELIYNTQYGVFRIKNKKELFDEDVKIHTRCLETGNVVYDSLLRQYKTHFTGPSGDGRVFAENTISTENGFTLHIFDKIDRHAHPRK